MATRIQNFWSNKWALTLSTGVLLGLSWPPLPLPFLVFPAFFFLFRLVDLCDSAREAALWSYPAFVIWNIITTYWLVMATVAGGIAAILANAAVMTVPFLGIYLAQKHLTKSWLIGLIQTSFWISYEYLHHHWDLAWPWLSIGNAWSNIPELVQYISATGYLGISFWVVLTSAIAYQGAKRTSRKLGFITIAAALLFPLVSLLQLPWLNTESDESLEVVVVQPNFDSYLDYGGFASARQSLELMMHLTDSAGTDNTKLAIWPENGLYPNVASREVNNPATNSIKPVLKAKSRNSNSTIIAGTRYYEYFPQDSAPPLSRYSGDTPYLTYNAALAFQPDSTMEIYRKYNLVPIVERVPFVHFLDAIDVGDWVDWRNNQGFGKGYEPDQFQVLSTKTPALICYDSVFPSWVREFVTRGAGFITVITNDGWWGDTSGHEQHFAYARLRAIEFRRWVVRSANNGISGIIAPDGSIQVETDYWTRTAFRYQVPIMHQQTIYAKFGDWLPISMLIISGLGIGLIYYRKN